MSATNSDAETGTRPELSPSTPSKNTGVGQLEDAAKLANLRADLTELIEQIGRKRARRLSIFSRTTIDHQQGYIKALEWVERRLRTLVHDELQTKVKQDQNLKEHGTTGHQCHTFECGKPPGTTFDVSTLFPPTSDPKDQR